MPIGKIIFFILILILDIIFNSIYEMTLDPEIINTDKK